MSLSLLVLIWQEHRENQAVAEAVALPEPELRANKASAGDAEVGQIYEFYYRLPKIEVVVPEKE